jgi:predicted nucleotidyltransferase
MKKQLYSVNEIRNIIAPVARSYGVGRVFLFGSYARGDATENSDIDLLIVDKGTLRGLFELAGFHLDLEDRFGIRVDVLTEGGLENEFLDDIRTEEVIVYDSQSRTA